MYNSELSHLKPTIRITPKLGYNNNKVLSCETVFEGKIPEEIKKQLDNPDGVMRISFQLSDTPKDHVLAERFKRAVEAGKIFINPHVVEYGGMWDNSMPGKSCWVEPFKLLVCDKLIYTGPGRLNADLKKIGY